MEIKLDSESLQTAVTESLQKSMGDAVNDYHFKDRIGSTITEGFEKFGFFDCINNALQKELESSMQSTADAVAKEIVKATASATVQILQQAMTDVVFTLRKGDSYLTSEEELKLKTRIKSEIFDSKS